MRNLRMHDHSRRQTILGIVLDVDAVPVIGVFVTRSRKAWRTLFTATLTFTAANCGGKLTLPPLAETPAVEGVAVSSLPPPALPEEIPTLTSEQRDLAWTDGCWEWSIGRWIWARGGWVEVPQRGTYFPGKIAVGPDGGLVWIPCTWVVDGKPIGLVAPVVPARYPASARTAAH